MMGDKNIKIFLKKMKGDLKYLTRKMVPLLAHKDSTKAQDTSNLLIDAWFS